MTPTPPPHQVHQLTPREAADITTALGSYARSVRDLAATQDAIADSDHHTDPDRAARARQSARSNRLVADEVEQLKAKLARARRVTVEVPD